MISIIKDICIFMIIAQAILFFVPGDSYMKYVRILVGIIMILRMTEPLFALVVNDEEQKQMLEHITMLEENININQPKLEIEDNSMGIYGSIEDEIKNRLEQCPNEQYEVTNVEWSSADKVSGQSGGQVETPEGIIVTVVSRNNVKNENINIEVKPIKVQKVVEDDNENSNSQKDSVLSGDTFLKEKDELKTLYGKCIGVDAERIEIVFAEE